jgi:ABC-2 type transport system ATP-binding protein
MVKDLLLDLRDQGITIIMSTHQMHQVEELCDRILLIDSGSVVLYGTLETVRRQFASNAVLLRVGGELPSLPDVEQIETYNGAYRLILSPDGNPQKVLNALLAEGIPLEKFEVAIPTLNEVFVQVVRNSRDST